MALLACTHSLNIFHRFQDLLMPPPPKLLANPRHPLPPRRAGLRAHPSSRSPAPSAERTPPATLIPRARNLRPTLPIGLHNRRVSMLPLKCSLVQILTAVMLPSVEQARAVSAGRPALSILPTQPPTPPRPFHQNPRRKRTALRHSSNEQRLQANLSALLC